jgi:methionine-rich copper-binding protein CopC
MKPQVRTFLALGATVIFTTAFAMHLRLVKSVPASGQVVTEKPTEIRLWFSQKPDVGLTAVRLLREDSTAIESGKVVATEDSLSVRVPLDKALVPGTYIVAWRSVSKDGHAVRGRYSFNMVPAERAN